MFIAKVNGHVVATQKIGPMVGQKMLVVEPYQVRDGSELQSTGRTLVAVDTVGAGEGELVLITQGSSARLAMPDSSTPVDCVIVGIVDSIDVGTTKVYTVSTE